MYNSEGKNQVERRLGTLHRFCKGMKNAASILARCDVLWSRFGADMWKISDFLIVSSRKQISLGKEKPGDNLNRRAMD